MMKDDFLILDKGYINLDNAATTYKPLEVLEEIKKYYLEYTSNANRGGYRTADIVNRKMEEVREKVCNLINAPSKKSIIFTSGATYGLNQIVSGFMKEVLDKDDEVILNYAEHSSNILPWMMNDINIKYAPLDENYNLTLSNIKTVVTPKTKVISLALTTNTIGDTRDLLEIKKYCKEKEIYLVVDASQGITTSKIDVTDIDFLVFSAHKMYGPTGVGVLYADMKHLEKMKPLVAGGGEVLSLDPLEFKDSPYKFEAGTQNIEGILGFSEALNYLERTSQEKIKKHTVELANYVKEELIKIEHITVYNLNTESSIVLFNVDGVFPEDVAMYLSKENIFIRSGDHCAKLLYKTVGVKNTCRASFAIYNTFEDAKKLIDALKDKEKIIEGII